MFSGNHSEMNYTDSVRDLMIYVHNAPEQMTGLARQLRWQRRGGPPACSPLPSLGPLWDAAPQAGPELRAFHGARGRQVCPARGTWS